MYLTGTAHSTACSHKPQVRSRPANPQSEALRRQALSRRLRPLDPCLPRLGRTSRRPEPPSIPSCSSSMTTAPASRSQRRTGSARCTLGDTCVTILNSLCKQLLAQQQPPACPPPRCPLPRQPELIARVSAIKSCMPASCGHLPALLAQARAARSLCQGAHLPTTTSLRWRVRVPQVQTRVHVDGTPFGCASHCYPPPPSPAPQQHRHPSPSQSSIPRSPLSLSLARAATTSRCRSTRP